MSTGCLPIHLILQQQRMSEVDRMPSDTFIVTATQDVRSRKDAFRYIQCYRSTEWQMSKGCLPIHLILQQQRMSEVDRMPSDTYIATATQNVRCGRDVLIHSLLQPHRIWDVDKISSATFIATATQNFRCRQDTFRYIYCYSHTECQKSKGCLPIYSVLQKHRMTDVYSMPSDTFIVTATRNVKSRQDTFRYIHCYSHTECQTSTRYLPINLLLQPHRMSNVDRMLSVTLIDTEVDRMPSNTSIATDTENVRRRQDAFRYIHCYSQTECQTSKGWVPLHSLLQPHRISDVDLCLPIHSLLQPHRMSDVDRMPSDTFISTEAQNIRRRFVPSDTFIATATQNVRRRKDAFQFIHCYSHTECQTSKGCLLIHSLLQSHGISDVDRMTSDTFIATATQNVRRRQDAFQYIHCYRSTEYQTSIWCVLIHSLLQPHRISDVDRMPSDTFIATATQNVRRRQDAFRYIQCYRSTEYHTSTGCLPNHSLLQPHRMSEFDRIPSNSFISKATQNIRRRRDAFRYIHCYIYLQISSGNSRPTTTPSVRYGSTTYCYIIITAHKILVI